MSTSTEVVGKVARTPPRMTRATGTVVLTLVVVVCEFLLLSYVHRSIHSETTADLVYAGLLIVASLGWMVWFRNLVARHRTLERVITEQRSEARSAERLAALVRSSADAIIVSDAGGRITYASPSSLTVLGSAPAELEGRHCSDLVVPDDRDAFRLALELVAANDDSSIRTRMHHAGGRTITVEGTASNLADNVAVGATVLTVRDVTERVRLEQALARQAFHDSLTDLANRQLFSDRLGHALAPRRSDDQRSLVVLFCDLDDFKNVNDSHGHGVGDGVLVEIGRRAAAITRPGDTVARLGGDEFAVLLEDADMDQALQIAGELSRTLSQPLTVEGYPLNLGVSIGLATAEAGSVTSEELLRQADVAMYLAKGRGKGTIAVYDSELHSAALCRLRLRDDLRNALSTDGIVAHFQPVVDIATGETTGFEALARWTTADGTVIPPSQFVPIAEQYGMIHGLGRAVLESACHHAVEFTQIAGRALTMSVNTTVQQLLRPDYVQEVMTVLAETGMPAHLLILEITESELAKDLVVVTDRLSALRSYGIRIAIDDFGTGFSSLSYLRDLPVDSLKVDKSFIQRVTEDPRDAELTLAIFAMASAVGLTTVAEGVEHLDQLEWLSGTNCSRAQGFLWAEALAADEASERVRPVTSGLSIGALAAPEPAGAGR